MTALRLNLGDRLLGERRGRDIHLVTYFSTTKNLFNTQDICIEDDGISFLLSKSCSDKDWDDLIDLTDIQNITGNGGFVVVFEPALAENRSADKVCLDKVVCIDSGVTPASTVSCSTTVLMGPTTTGA